MPRHIERNYLPLARTLNRKAWAPVSIHGPAFRRAVASMEELSDRTEARYLQERRDRLVEAIHETSEYPDLFWRHSYFAGLRAGVVLSTSEAVDELMRELQREQSRCKARHWSAKPWRIAKLREALVFARYFRRFSKRVWVREAA